MIRLLFFASVRDRLGRAEETLEAPPETIGALREQLAARGETWHSVFGPDQRLLAAVNQDMANPETRLNDGDEVGFFPPVTGG